MFDDNGIVVNGIDIDTIYEDDYLINRDGDILIYKVSLISESDIICQLCYFKNLKTGRLINLNEFHSNGIHYKEPGLDIVGFVNLGGN